MQVMIERIKSFEEDIPAETRAEIDTAGFRAETERRIKRIECIKTIADRLRHQQCESEAATQYKLTAEAFSTLEDFFVRRMLLTDIAANEAVAEAEEGAHSDSESELHRENQDPAESNAPVRPVQTPHREQTDPPERISRVQAPHRENADPLHQGKRRRIAPEEASQPNVSQIVKIPDRASRRNLRN